MKSSRLAPTVGCVPIMSNQLRPHSTSPSLSVTTDNENIDVTDDESNTGRDVTGSRTFINDDDNRSKSNPDHEDHYHRYFDLSDQTQRKPESREYSRDELRDLRSKINSRERKRMHDLNSAMDSLREVMPCATGPSVRKLSKIATLTLAKNYIQMLSKSVAEMKQLLEDLHRGGVSAQPVPPAIAHSPSYLPAPHHNVAQLTHFGLSSNINATSFFPYPPPHLHPHIHSPGARSSHVSALCQHGSSLLLNSSAFQQVSKPRPSATAMTSRCDAVSRVRPTSLFQTISCTCPSLSGYSSLHQESPSTDNMRSFLGVKRGVAQRLV